MPKMKTHSGAKKRFKKTKNGLIKAGGACHRHLLTKKSAKRKRNLRKCFYLCPADVNHIASLLP